MRRCTSEKHGRASFALGQLNVSEFPTGKLWMSYPMLTNKQTAQVVHLNWVKSTKKLHLRRDNLWFLTEDDQRCAAGFDPFEGRLRARVRARDHVRDGPAVHSRPRRAITSGGA